MPLDSNGNLWNTGRPAGFIDLRHPAVTGLIRSANRHRCRAGGPGGKQFRSQRVSLDRSPLELNRSSGHDVNHKGRSRGRCRRRQPL